MGIAAEAISVESKGETQLLVKTQAAEARNRRVEVKFDPHVTPSLGRDSAGAFGTSVPSFGGGFTTESNSTPGLGLPPKKGREPSRRPGSGAICFREQGQAARGRRIRELTELIKKTSDAVKRDPLVRKLRDALAAL